MKVDRSYRLTFRRIQSFGALIKVEVKARTLIGAIRRARKCHLLSFSRWEVVAVA